jgi:20S proteasome alpha/beta subunit
MQLYEWSTARLKYKKPFNTIPKMTCIISGKAVDGVVLVADRKIRYGNGNVTSRDKIFKDYHPFPSHLPVIQFRSTILGKKR